MKEKYFICIYVDWQTFWLARLKDGGCSDICDGGSADIGGIWVSSGVLVLLNVMVAEGGIGQLV